MLTIRPTCADWVVDKKKVTEGLPGQIRLVRDNEVVILGDAEGARLHPKSVHACATRATVHVNYEWGIGRPRISRLEKPIKEIIIVGG